MILIKRYGLPLLISIVLYSVVYFVFGSNSNYINIGIFMSVILSYLIRICDDIGDYEKDREAGKAPLGKEVLIVIGIFFVLLFIALVLIAEKYLMLVSLLVILLQFLIKDRYRDAIKPLFMPTVVITLVFSFFTPGLWLYVTALILLIIDVLLIIYKRRRSL